MSDEPTEFYQPPTSETLRFWWLDGSYEDYRVTRFRRTEAGVLINHDADKGLMVEGSVFIPYTSFRAMKLLDLRQ